MASKKKYSSPDEYANELFSTHYAVLIGANNDLSEEIVITELAKKHSIITLKVILEREVVSSPEKIKFYNEVIRNIKIL